MNDPLYWIIGGSVIVLMLLWLAFRSHVDPEQRARDRAGLGHVCCACGHVATRYDLVVLDGGGMRVHRSHTEDPASGLYGTRQ